MVTPLHFLGVVPEIRLFWTVKKSSQIYLLKKSLLTEFVACGVSALREFPSSHTSICCILFCENEELSLSLPESGSPNAGGLDEALTTRFKGTSLTRKRTP